ncbi:MAG: NADH-quinone oxidoreductase subunit NuoK [Promethearchaeia archaeon]
MIPLSYFLAFSAGLYIIGIYCLVSKRNMIRLVLGIEIILNAANINFITFSIFRSEGFVDPFAQSLVVISITLASCVSAAALSLVIYAYRHYETLDVRELRRLQK